MKKIAFLLCFFLVWVFVPVLAQEDKPVMTPTPNGLRDLEVEKLQLEIERLKLENQRLQLQIQSLQMGKPEEKKEAKKEDHKEEKKFATDVAAKSEELAKQNATNEKIVVFDFTNGEIWYKGIRNKLNDFAQFCRDQKWEAKGEFIKYDVNGDSEERYRHQNMWLDKYFSQSKGVFVFEAPGEANDLSFVTPEGITQESSFGDIRNRFETPYFTLDKEYKDKGMRVLRFKHTTGFLSFADVLEFRFTSHDQLQEVKWGILDKK